MRLIILCMTEYHSGGMFCLNQATGEIRWSKQINQPIMASPGIIKDKVFFAASDKKMYCLQKNDGLKVWDFETGDKIWSSPSISEYDMCYSLVLWMHIFME